MENPEKSFEDVLVKELKLRHAFAHHFDAVGCDGWPDLIVLKDDSCALVECKYMTTELRKEQSAFHMELALKYGFTNILVASKHKGGYHLNVFLPDGTYSGTAMATIKNLVSLILHYTGGGA